MTSSLSLDSHVATDAVAESEWNEYVLGFQDATINQTWSFGASLSGQGNLSHVVVRRDGTVAALAQVRLVRTPVINRGMAYLAWGPLWHRTGNERDFNALREILHALGVEYTGRRRLYLEVKPHLWDTEPEAGRICQLFAAAGFRHLPSAERTVTRSLEPALPEIRKHVAQKWRNQLNYAEKSGLEAAAGTENELLDRFVPVYREMVSRKDYPNPVDIARFVAMSKAQPDSLKPLVVLASLGGEVIAGGVFSVVGTTGIYLLGGTSKKGLAVKASYLVQWRAIEWMKQRGLSVYDVGGTDRVRSPGTYHFKAGICGKDPREQTRLGTFVACSSPLSRGAVILGKFVRGWRRR
jgi:lipid II:glycine glycyltransferase (peptidoglycan interpeptide bridge formation enzyme)